jgi:CYTH domain-containing protein
MEEFELTYLAKKELMSKLNGISFKEMTDIYIPESSKHPNLRIRKSGEKYEITKKTPVREGDASHQIETTISLTLSEFNELNLIKGKRVLKNRYLYQENNYTYEIDVFQGDLKGLVLVDVEFKSNEEKSNFIPPPWILKDVTQENFIAGGMLCGKNYDTIKEKLEEFKYEKINITN